MTTPNNHEYWCPFSPHHGYKPEDGLDCECDQPTVHAVLEEVRANRAVLDSVHAEVLGMRELLAEMGAKFDKAAGQIDQVAQMAGPAIEQLAASPILKMLGGKRGN